MTIGEKIKYVRKLYHMSSSELANKTGIHPVSIRKYESNKMVPASAQIERIAAVFCLPHSIFNGLTEMRFDFQYSGDCLAFLIMLYTSGALTLNGDRNEKNILIKETVRFTFAPFLNRFVEFSKKDKILPYDEINILIQDQDTLDRFLFWEFMYNRRDELYDLYMEEETEESKKNYDEMCDYYDEVEMNTFLQGRLGDIIMRATFKDL